MTAGYKLTQDSIAIDRDMQIDSDIGQEITVYIETWFDVDTRFHINTSKDDDTWLNMYGRYNPFNDSLLLECEISRRDGSSFFEYEPTADETELIKETIAETIRENYYQTPQEFCENNYNEEPTIGGLV